MPNWCEDYLEVTGPEEEITRFKEAAKGEDSELSFQALHPMPFALENTLAPSRKPDSNLISVFGADNWWDWHIKFWGTKWDACEVELYEKLPKKLAYGFETAWSPPIELLEKVSKDYPKLRFKLKYYEPGVGFKGITRAKNGVVTDKCREI